MDSVYDETSVAPTDPRAPSEPWRVVTDCRGPSRPARRRAVGLAVLVVCTSPALSAQESDAEETSDESIEWQGSVGTENSDDVLGRSPKRGFAALNRPAGAVELGVGWLTLPAAE